MDKRFIITVFTKYWKTLSPGELADKVASLGFKGVEFPLRDGYQAEPADAERSLPRLARELNGSGIKIMSVASTTDEHIFAACAAAGVPLIRIMFGNKLNRDYFEAEAEMKRTIEGFLPLCEKYGVKVGVQQHCGPGVNNTMEMYRLLENYDANLVGGIWDAGHSGLAGEEPEQAIDIIKSKLAIVNFKNAFYRRVNGPEAAEGVFRWYFTTGSQGVCSWRRALTRLRDVGYSGNVCLTAEYSDGDNTESYAAEDCAYVKQLIDGIYGGDSY